jgi:transposase
MDKLTAVSNDFKVNLWITRIKECRNSGMKVSAWCQQNDIGIKTYYYWMRKIKREAFEALPVEFKESIPTLSDSKAPVFSRINLSTDMRKSIDGLASLVQQNFKLDPFSNSLFLFCGHKCDRLKALYWEGDGFVLLYKRLENGRLQWPRNEKEVRQLSNQEFRWLLEGLSLNQPKAVQKVSIKNVI